MSEGGGEPRETRFAGEVQPKTARQVGLHNARTVRAGSILVNATPTSPPRRWGSRRFRARRWRTFAEFRMAHRRSEIHRRLRMSSAETCSEVDGGQHLDNGEDESRTRLIEERGPTPYRFWTRMLHIDGVRRTETAARCPLPNPPPTRRREPDGRWRNITVPTVLSAAICDCHEDASD